MLAKFNFFEPAGPLAYLLMSPKGERVLGLYQSIKDNSLVIIFPLAEKEYVINPSQEQLSCLMQNKCTLADITHTDGKSNLTDINGNIPGLFTRIRISQYLTKELGGKLSEMKSVILYPNFYYVYSEFCFNKGEKKK